MTALLLDRPAGPRPAPRFNPAAGHVTDTLLAAALALHDAGCSVVPARPDGSKAPATEWRWYQQQRPATGQVQAWLGNGTYDGFGVICGAVSGGLEMLEFEGRAVAAKLHVRYRDMLADHGLLLLWQQITNGYTEVTPGGGLHILYRVDGHARGNTKLARNATGDVLIETRGEGGFTILAPSGGRTHPTGRPWQIAAGGPATIVTITEEQRDSLHAIASFLDEQPPPPAAPQHQPGTPESGRPGDDFNTRASWEEILVPHGWRYVRAFGENAHGWRRPGKEGPGISATVRDNGGLYVFSTSTPFDTETPYSKFGAYALLNHSGDHSAAAAQLRRNGYGEPGQHPDHDISGLIAPGSSPDPTAAAAEAKAALPGRILPGGCILDIPAIPESVWGDGADILWAAGQSLIIVGPDGVGKTTLSGNLIEARLGLGNGEVLGLPVRAGERNVLVLLMDRPQQAMAALARLFTEKDRELLDAKLRVWRGPPPQDLAHHPAMLTELCALADADTVVIDSLKDAALKLSDDETGSGWNRARQLAIEAGVQLIELHHPRKGQEGNRKPRKIDDLYGSRWIPAGAGSIISLWGEPGDPVVELSHLKPVTEIVGPWQMNIDGATGRVSVSHGIDIVDQVRQRGRIGMTVKVAANLLYGSEKPAQVQRARRLLDKKVDAGLLRREGGQRGGNHETGHATYFAEAITDLITDQSRAGQAITPPADQVNHARGGIFISPERDVTAGTEEGML